PILGSCHATYISGNIVGDLPFDVQSFHPLAITLRLHRPTGRYRLVWRFEPVEAISGRAGRLGLGNQIIQTLRDYRRSLPLDFIATALKATPKEVTNEVALLETRGILKRVGDNVTLATLHSSDF